MKDQYLKYCKWMNGFMDSWKALEGTKIVNWLSSDVEYYESPDGKPCKSLHEVLALWEVVPKNQRDITYSYDIVCCSDDICVFNWKMNRTLLTADGELHQKIDGIFVVSLDENNKCKFFKQWRSTVSQ